MVKTKKTEATNELAKRICRALEEEWPNLFKEGWHHDRAFQIVSYYVDAEKKVMGEMVFRLISKN